MRQFKLVCLVVGLAWVAGSAVAAENFVPGNREAGAAPAAEIKKARKLHDPLKLKSAFAQKEWERSGLKEFTGNVKSSVLQNPITSVSGFFKKQSDRYQERKAGGSNKTA